MVSIEQEKEWLKFIEHEAQAAGFLKSGVANDQDDSYLVLALPYLPTTRESRRTMGLFVCRDNYGLAVRQAKVLRKRLAGLWLVPSKEMQIMCNSNSINEKELAVKSGLGFYGKNSLVYVSPWGSFVVLLVIKLPYRFESIQNASLFNSMCNGCTLCQRACPSQALHRAYHLDRTLCLQSMASNGVLPVSDNLPVIYGCDICQNVCPYNKQALDYYRDMEGTAVTEAWCDLKLWEHGSLKDVYRVTAKSPLRFKWLDKKALALNAKIRAWYKAIIVVRKGEQECD